MARGRDDEDEYEEEEGEMEEEEEEEEEEEDQGRGRGSKRGPSEFIDDVAEEDDEEEEEEDDDDDEDYGGGGGVRKKQRRRTGSEFFELEAAVDSDDEEEDDGDAEDDFINDAGADLPDGSGGRRVHRPSLLRPEDQEEDMDDIARMISQRYSRQSHVEYGEDATEVEQQALLPSVKDPKLWLVKCQQNHERELAICLMQKFIDRPDLHIRSAISLDHLKGFIYVEADREAHVKEACRGMRNIFSSAKIELVPIKEMTDVLSVESKTVDLARDTWVRMKIGVYKGDLAKVVDVDNVRQKVTVKLIPRIDLQHLANKIEGRDSAPGRKRTFVPPPRLFNSNEAKELNIHVEHRKNRETGERYEMVDNMMFKDGYLYKIVAMRSITTHNIQPTFDELEKFRAPDADGSGDGESLSALFANRKKGHFMKGDAVIVVRGDLKNLMGTVEKVEEENVHIKPKMAGLPKTLAFNEKELCKYFKPGDHVKVISGVQEGATGMVVKVESHILTILSDTTKEDIRVFADNVVESSEVTAGITKIGDYELHDLVLLDDTSFGVIIRVESGAVQVLKGVPDRPEVVLVKLMEIKAKIDKPASAQDQKRNKISLKDIVKVVEGPCKGRQGPVERIHRGILFIYDRHHLEHAGFICVRAQSCILLGGSHAGNDRNGTGPMDSRFDALRSSPNFMSPSRLPRPGFPDSGGRQRGGRGFDALIGKSIKIRSGPFKGYRGRVKSITNAHVRVELDSQMKIVSVKRDEIADATGSAFSGRETPRYGYGSETPMHPSRTPLHPYQTPMRDPSATPIHDGMRTPMRDRAWAPMSPPRDHWDDNPAPWSSSPRYEQPGTPPVRTYEAPTPGSGWANTPGLNYNAETPRDSSSPYGNVESPYVPSTPGQPMTPSSYLPGTPGGQPMTPGNVGIDVMSPTMGEGDGNWFMPDILVTVQRPGEDPRTAVVKEMLMDGTCRVALGSAGNGEIVTVVPAELDVVRPRKSDRIKILSGGMRGYTGRLLGLDGSDGIVKLDENLEVKILDLEMLGKLAAQ